MKKQINIIISTHQGILYNEVCDYIVVKKSSGEFAMLPDHIPTITSIDEGFIELDRDKDKYYVNLVNAALEFHDNVCNVIAQEAFIGRSMEHARSQLNQIKKERLEKNRVLDTNLEIKEKELRDSIKEAHAGNL